MCKRTSVCSSGPRQNHQNVNFIYSTGCPTKKCTLEILVFGVNFSAINFLFHFPTSVIIVSVISRRHINSHNPNTTSTKPNLSWYTILLPPPPATTTTTRHYHHHYHHHYHPPPPPTTTIHHNHPPPSTFLTFTKQYSEDFEQN